MFWWFLAEGGFLLSFGILKKRNSILFTFHRYTKAEAVISNGHVHLRKAFCRDIPHLYPMFLHETYGEPVQHEFSISTHLGSHYPGFPPRSVLHWFGKVSCDKLSPYRQLSPFFKIYFCDCNVKEIYRENVLTMFQSVGKKRSLRFLLSLSVIDTKKETKRPLIPSLYT